MNYSDALKSNFTPKPADLRLCLAHFPHSDRLGRLDVIEAVEKSAKIRLCGIRNHPKGAVLALRSEEDLKKIREANTFCKKTRIIFTPYPEIQLPLAERGRRWRIWGIPFTTTEEELQKALTTETCTVTAVKLEYVPGRPDIRTESATFWVKEVTAVPNAKEICGEKIFIFDPTPKPKSPKASAAPTTPSNVENPSPVAMPAPSNAQQAPEPTAAPAKEKDLPSPTTSTASVFAKPQQAAPAPAASAETPPRSSPTSTPTSVAQLPLPQSPRTHSAGSPSLKARLEQADKVTAELLQGLAELEALQASRRIRAASTSPGTLRQQTSGDPKSKTTRFFKKS